MAANSTPVICITPSIKPFHSCFHRSHIKLTTYSTSGITSMQWRVLTKVRCNLTSGSWQLR